MRSSRPGTSSPRQKSAKNPFFKKVYESQRAYAAKVVPAKRFMFPPYALQADYYWPVKEMKTRVSVTDRTGRAAAAALLASECRSTHLTTLGSHSAICGNTSSRIRTNTWMTM